MGWLTAFRKHRAIRSYLREAGPALLRRYGFCEGYSPQQVLATVSAARLSQKHVAYACALFTPKLEFVAWVLTTGAVTSKAQAFELYRALRAELAEEYNGGHDFVLKPPRKDFDQVYPLAKSAYSRGSGFRWYR